ncbi:MAG: tetratricopeptide repeat protein [Polyangiaceae bacterium]
MRRPASWVLGVALALSLAVGGCIDRPTEHRVRANAFLRAGEADKALEEVKAGLDKSPDDVGLLMLQGKALFELSRYDEAKTSYEAALEHGKDMGASALGEGYLGLAMVALRQERFADARQWFQKLVDTNDQDASAHINLARLCLQLEDLPCAVEHGEAAGRLRGKSEDVLFTLGRIYIVAKKLDEAEKTFQHICEVVPRASSCPYGVALVAAQRGDKEAAMKKLEEAIALKLPNPDKLGDDPLLAPLADDPAFKKLAGK